MGSINTLRLGKRTEAQTETCLHSGLVNIPWESTFHAPYVIMLLRHDQLVMF